VIGSFSNRRIISAATTLATTLLAKTMCTKTLVSILAKILCAKTRVDSRQDNNERLDTSREIRQDYERGIACQEAHHPRNVDSSLSSYTMEDMQRTMAMLQSQLDKQACQSSRDDSNKPSRLAFA
jgi:hypothetical protein